MLLKGFKVLRTIIKIDLRSKNHDNDSKIFKRSKNHNDSKNLRSENHNDSKLMVLKIKF